MMNAPANILTTLNNPLVAYVNQNDRDGIGNPTTPQPATNAQTLYYQSPTGGGRIPIIQMNSSTGNQIFIAPPGNAVAYFRVGSSDATTGLYVVDLNIGIIGRLLPIKSLVQRGIVSLPSWSPDGTRLAMTLSTAYDLDIFTVGSDGSNPRNVTNSGSYDFYPAYSPDGQHLLFVSDRATCPTWIPGQPNTCDGTGAPPPIGGNLYVLEIASGNVRQLSGQFISEPPMWLNNRQIAFTSGDPLFGDSERALFVVDISNGRETRLRSASGADDPLKLAEAWTQDGGLVFYQAASSRTELVMMGDDGRVIGRTNEFNFPRYGMDAVWSPDGQRVAIGGIGGQCPYGLIVITRTFEVLARGNPPPGACAPQWSPDGRFIAFAGVSPRAANAADGRVDVYVAGANGFGAGNLTSSLRGTIMLIGWVGGTSS